MPNPAKYTVGQRVRINEQDDPPTHVGKMALVEEIELSQGGEPACVLKIDRSKGPHAKQGVNHLPASQTLTSENDGPRLI